MKINLMNLNRQGKLYSQGHVPLIRTLPGKSKWERLRERTTYEVLCMLLFCLVYWCPIKTGDVKTGTNGLSQVHCVELGLCSG